MNATGTVSVTTDHTQRALLSARYVAFAPPVTSGVARAVEDAILGELPGACWITVAGMREDETSLAAVVLMPLTGAAAAAAAATMPCAMACVRMSCAMCPELSDAWIFFNRSRTSCAVGRKLLSFFRQRVTSWSSSGGISGL